MQRAARYFYLQRAAFGGKVTGQTFGACTDRPPRVNILNLEQTIHDAWLRLAGVTIECLDYRSLIPKYDRPRTFFFMDTPYWQIPGYHHDFKEQDFLDLAEVLTNLKGCFIMTINDTPQIREIFKSFTIEETRLKYSFSKSAEARKKTHTELLISN